MRDDARVPELDGIRGVACIMVLLAHCFVGITRSPPGWESATANAVWFVLGGVDLFFVLSGFLIGGILMDTKGQPGYFRRFWIRRVARIFPVTYILLGTYALALLVTSAFGITRLNGWLLSEPKPPLWMLATFTQNFAMALPGGINGPKWVGVTWSLAVEEQFYLLFPFVVFLLPRRALPVLVVAGLVIAPFIRAWLEQAYGNWFAPYVLLPSRMDGLLYGVGAALIVRNKTALAIATRWRLVIDAIGLGLLIVLLSNYRFEFWPGENSSPLRQSAMTLMWGIVVLRVFTHERDPLNAIWRTPLLMAVGTISFALYMYHQTVNGMVHEFVFDRAPVIDGPVSLFAAFAVVAIATGLALLSWRYVERPARALGRRLSLRNAPAEVDPIHRAGEDAVRDLPNGIDHAAGLGLELEARDLARRGEGQVRHADDGIARRTDNEPGIG